MHIGTSGRVHKLIQSILGKGVEIIMGKVAQNEASWGKEEDR